MNAPVVLEPRRCAPDTHVVTTHLPVPGLGLLPVNAFVLRAAEPVLVDLGVTALGGDFAGALAKAVDLEEVRWIWLTHTDHDHVGALDALLAAAPRATLVTTFLGLAKLGLRGPFPAERTRLLAPGERLDVGDRRLLALRPPTFDAPETTGLLDERTGALFCADSFGAPLGAPAERAEDVPVGSLAEGIAAWAGIDAPWLGLTSAGAFEAALEQTRALSPAAVLGSHLPPAGGAMLPALIEALSEARAALASATAAAAACP